MCNYPRSESELTIFFPHPSFSLAYLRNWIPVKSSPAIRDTLMVEEMMTEYFFNINMTDRIRSDIRIVLKVILSMSKY